jgi:hypothetical protein
MLVCIIFERGLGLLRDIKMRVEEQVPAELNLLILGAAPMVEM